MKLTNEQKSLLGRLYRGTLFREDALGSTYQAAQPGLCLKELGLARFTDDPRGTAVSVLAITPLGRATWEEINKETK